MTIKFPYNSVQFAYTHVLNDFTKLPNKNLGDDYAIGKHIIPPEKCTQLTVRYKGIYICSTDRSTSLFDSSGID